MSMTQIHYLRLIGMKFQTETLQYFSNSSQPFSGLRLIATHDHKIIGVPD